MELLLYARSSSARLQYICQFIFADLWSVKYSITSDESAFEQFNGIKLKYANEAALPGCVTIGDCGLLFESDIREQDLSSISVKGVKAFFITGKTDVPFDLLSACFYLLSRYEEYLPHKLDQYGRYAHENSLAFRENFLELPIINTWVIQLAETVRQKLGISISFRQPFRFLPTYDIDIAYAYKHKGWARNLGRFIASPSIDRIAVLLGLRNDPFNAYAWLDEIHQRCHLQPIYFFLVAERNGRYDKNILPRKNGLQQLVRVHAKKYPVGLHPSWRSGDRPELLGREKQLLEKLSAKPVTRSRQHYIRFSLPEGYRRLIQAGITDDYSMGYGTINGFRASVASSFYWFDLERNQPTSLRIHPYCFMEANSFYEQKISASEAAAELIHYYRTCKSVGGQMITIWHNNFLGSDASFIPWRNAYEWLLEEIKIAEQANYSTS